MKKNQIFFFPKIQRSCFHCQWRKGRSVDMPAQFFYWCHPATVCQWRTLEIERIMGQMLTGIGWQTHTWWQNSRFPDSIFLPHKPWKAAGGENTLYFQGFKRLTCYIFLNHTLEKDYLFMLLEKKTVTHVDSAQPRTQLQTLPSSAEGLLLLSSCGHSLGRGAPACRAGWSSKGTITRDPPLPKEGQEFIDK